MDLTPGALFGRYRLEERLGGGSFGSVWRAINTETEQVVALKILAGSYSESEGAQLRTDVELLAAAAAAGSAHVVKVLGGGIDPAPHVVMEFLGGTDLAETLAARGKLDQTQVIDMGEAVADALATLARVGIVHRDVKPANIMLGPDGSVKLTDFGIAKIVGFDTVTSTGQLPLTMAYAAPEVWDGKASSASDLYALGVVLYQCLTGKLPFTGSYHEIYQAHMSKTPDLDALPPETTPALRSLIEACMAKDPAARPTDPASALAALQRARTELDARRGAPGGKPPVSFGPWKLIAAHPTRQWAWGAQHEKTGERAIVEVCFGASAALGETLHRAVEANAALVPLGAERLLGTNRLILRPGEAWPVTPPSGPFAFWVARKELPTPPPSTVGEPELRRLVEATETLWATATAAGLRLDLGPSALVALPDGSVHLRRPGLPPDTALDPQAAALDSIRRLPLDLALTATVARAPSLQALGRVLGVADVPTDVSIPEAATLPPTVVIKPGGEESGVPAVAPVPVQSLPAEGGDRRRRRRVAVAIGLGAIVVALVAATAFGAFFAGGAHPSPTGSGQLVAAGSITSPSPSLAGDSPTAYVTGAAPSMSGPPVPSRSSTQVPGKTSTPIPVGPVAPTPLATPTPVITPTPSPVVTPKPAPAVFTTSGVFTVPAGGATLRVLIVAGGGGGGDGGGSGGQSRPGGGGGGGGVIDQTLYVPQGTYNVTVGAGGLRNGNGGNSSFYTLTAIGGGAGGAAENGNGQAGGSGGGGANNGNRGSGTGGQGNDGGDGDHNSPQTGGGGGGASGGGMTATIFQGGFGGAGKASDITGTNAYYGGGGGGGACAAGAGPGTGGAGGGGYGGGNNGPQPNAGAAHTGGGGGGSGGYDSGSTAAAPGGSGIVVIAYV